MDNNAMYRFSYGLFVLTARDGDKDNGCIINTAAQATVTPNRILITVSKENYTHDMIVNTGYFNLSILTESAPFSVYQNWGYQSGKNIDKLEGITFQRSENGLVYLTEDVNAYVSARVVSSMDLGTHTLFLADVEEAQLLSEEESVTYSYYQKNVKPAPKKTDKKKTGYICTVCGYIYEGDPLPEDFICPLCKHGAADFIKL